MNTEETKKIFIWVRFALIVLSIFLIAEALNAFKDWQSVDSAFNSFSVTGTGDSISVPDIATFSFSVSADGKDVSTAQGAVTKNTDAILAGLKDLGIAEADIKNTDYSVYPKYTYAPVNQTPCVNGYCPPANRVPDGYTVNQTILVKVRKTADAGKALAVAGDKGATNISGLTFTTDDPNKNEDDARAKAIANAKSKADDLAKSLGVRIIRVVGYADNLSTPMPIYPGYVGVSAKLNASVTVPAGENKTTANVTVTYEIR